MASQRGSCCTRSRSSFVPDNLQILASMAMTMIMPTRNFSVVIVSLVTLYLGPSRPTPYLQHSGRLSGRFLFWPKSLPNKTFPFTRPDELCEYLWRAFPRCRHWGLFLLTASFAGQNRRQNGQNVWVGWAGCCHLHYNENSQRKVPIAKVKLKYPLLRSANISLIQIEMLLFFSQ